MESQMRTLVVEDEPTARFLIQEVLRKRGHIVEACADAESAWEIAQREPFSLALLDMRLPGMDGVELCRKLRKLPYRDQLVVVFVTAADSAEDLGRALEAGADDYVLKPVGEANLPARIALAERRVHFLRDRKVTEEGLLQDALKDSVTDLVNRTLFFERLQRTARRAAREQKKPGRAGRYLYAVLILNMDGFGRVNARLGYEGGNEVLREVGQRLEECLRSADTVARFGGDEFVVLLDDMKDVSDPTRVVQRVEQAFARPFVTPAGEIHLTTCVGIALSLRGTTDPSQLVEEARSALVQAKEQGPGTYQVHDVVVHARAVARLQLEARLRWAIENGEMELYYQPIVSLGQAGVVGFEALARWHDPRRGLVGPEEFVAVAEDTGAIFPLGKWVIETAARQLHEWNAEYRGGKPPLFMSVNVSGRQLTHTDLVEQIAAVMRASGISPEELHVEITETSLMTDLQAATSVVRQLKEIGLQVYVDDFGTGYSSLSYLSRLPLDGLKIDRSFVSHMTDSDEDREIVYTIIHLADSLRLDIVAEGVETDRQHAELRELGCHLGQGYLFGRPTSASDITALLRNRAVALAQDGRVTEPDRGV